MYMCMYIDTYIYIYRVHPAQIGVRFVSFQKKKKTKRRTHRRRRT